MKSNAETPVRTSVAAAALLLASCATQERGGRSRPVSDTPVKIGAPYQAAGRTWIPADDVKYDEVGYASWYGAEHAGRATANGEAFAMDGISAAHATLPLPSYAEVTALDSGRIIIVRINDRGPFSPDRIVDLSRGAAKLLGIERAGPARVRVRRVNPSEADKAALRAGRPAAQRLPAPPQLLAALNARFAMSRERAPAVAAPRVPISPAGRRTGSHYVQVAALSDRARADALAASLASYGPVQPAAAGNVWRVRIGPFSSDAEARDVLARVRRGGYQEARVVRDPLAQSDSPMEPPTR